MLAIIDGLRTKLTALSDVVQGLASGFGFLKPGFLKPLLYHL